eukprot:scaffold1900_cov389-Prasinococcus_capsulatus_cf.AAC.3
MRQAFCNEEQAQARWEPLLSSAIIEADEFERTMQHKVAVVAGMKILFELARVHQLIGVAEDGKALYVIRLVRLSVAARLGNAQVFRDILPCITSSEELMNIVRAARLHKDRLLNVTPRGWVYNAQLAQMAFERALTVSLSEVTPDTPQVARIYRAIVTLGSKTLSSNEDTESLLAVYNKILKVSSHPRRATVGTPSYIVIPAPDPTTALQMILDKVGSESKYPTQELQWLVAMSWNAGLELYAGGRLLDAERFFRVALDLLKCVTAIQTLARRKQSWD